MKRFIYFVIFNLLMFSNVNGEKIDNFTINGNERISDQTIILFTEKKLSQKINENDLNDIIKNLYKTNFFSDVTVNFNNNILNITVVENPIIQSIIITGIDSKKYTEPLYNIMSIKEKSSYVEYNVKTDLNKIISFLKYSGFYFSKVEIDLKKNDNNTVDLIYNIELGEKALIKNINFTGDKIFKDKFLKNIIISEEAKFWKFLSSKKFLDEKRIELDTRLLKNFYLNKGYYNVNIESTSASLTDDGFILKFNINSGEKFYFNRLSLIIPADYEKNNFSEIYKSFNYLENKSYSLNEIKKILDQINTLALSKQYEFIDAKLEENIIDNNKLDIKITIGESKKYYVNRINIMGNDITDENVIRNMLVVDEGDPLNVLLNKKSINKIRASNLFANVDIKTIDINDSQKDMSVIVEEKPTGEISAGAGVGSSGTTFTAGIKENNFNGKGIRLNTSLTVSPKTISGNINWVAPNYKYSNKSLIGDISRSTTDLLTTSGYKNKLNLLSIGTSYEHKEDFYFSPNLSFKYETLETSGSASAELKKQADDYYDINLDYGVYYNKLNQSYAPSEGYSSSFNQQVPLFSNNYSLVNTYEFRKYNEISDQMIGSIKFYAKSINSLSSGKDVRVSKRIKIPSHKIRGFEPGKIGPIDSDSNFVGGNYASAINISTTLPTFLPELQTLDLNFFIDAATLWGVDYKESLEKGINIRSSLGFSIDWTTPVGPLNFVLAQPITKESTDKTESFRFNLGTTF